METVFKAINSKKTGGAPLQEAKLPAFQSEKTVRAAKILAIQYAVDRGTYRLALAGGFHVDVTKVWVNKRSPHVGGYFVQYQDGFSSFSPAAPFEQGYVALAEPADGPGPTEIKTYSDGTTAMGPGPLPDLSPEQQDEAKGPGALPSAADLDAVAQEQAEEEANGAQSA